MKSQMRSPRRAYANNIVGDEEIASLLAELEGLATRHDPSHGESSAHGKDLAAFQAIRLASRLTELVAGWAIKHQIGLAIQGLEYVPRGPEDLKEDSSLKAALEAVDQHAHEYNGHDVVQVFEEQPPKVVQRLLFNIFRPQANLPYTIYLPLVEGLQALLHGSRPSVFSPLVAGQKKPFKKRVLILRAIGFVAFKHRVGSKKADAEAFVLKAYGAKSDKIDSWVKQAKEWFSEWRVRLEVELAERAASVVLNYRQMQDSGETGDTVSFESAIAKYDNPAIIAAGEEFRRLTKK